MKLSDFTDVFLFPNRLLFSQRADDTGGKEGQHIVQMIDWGGGWGSYQNAGGGNSERKRNRK